MLSQCPLCSLMAMQNIISFYPSWDWDGVGPRLLVKLFQSALCFLLSAKRARNKQLISRPYCGMTLWGGGDDMAKLVRVWPIRLRQWFLLQTR